MSGNYWSLAKFAALLCCNKELQCPPSLLLKKKLTGTSTKIPKLVSHPPQRKKLGSILNDQEHKPKKNLHFKKHYYKILAELFAVRVTSSELLCFENRSSDKNGRN